MANPIPFAVVGMGVIGKTHARAVVDAEGADLAAVVDTDIDRARAIGEKYGAPTFGSVDELIGSGLVTAATIGVPSGTHAQVGIPLAEAGIHLLCEKPIDVSLEAADRLISSCEASGVTLACISQSRFEPDLRAARELVQSGRLGRTVLAQADTKWYRSQDYYDAGGWRGTFAQDGGGALINQSIHAIDALQWVMGPVERVCGFTTNRWHEMEAEDTGAAILQFRSGALGVIQGATSLGKAQPKRLEFHGEAGTIVLENDAAIAWDVDDGSTAPSAASGSGPRKGAGADARDVGHIGHIRQVEDLVRAIVEGVPPEITGADARAPLELILAIYESANSGGTPVTLPLAR
ncbi:MAG: Gfo/Idh/MocA family oxidoreductase [Chloroflexi bacterium]|nr:Gfo/Idh/MocA family oxidoreductase [Chloroflexota bacterium]